MSIISTRFRLLFQVALLSLATMLFMQSCFENKQTKNTGKRPVEYTLTVAAIKPPADGAQFYEVTFLESARFYRLPKNASPQTLQLLTESRDKGTKVSVRRSNEYSDEILTVKRATNCRGCPE